MSLSTSPDCGDIIVSTGVKYGAVRHHLEQQDTPIGENDLLIAAHALSLGLSVENWLNT